VTQGPATEKAEMQETKIVKMGYSLRNDRWRHTEWIQAGTKRVVAREFYDHQDTNTPSQNLANESDQ
jgi:iduronate 2-sulfatase